MRPNSAVVLSIALGAYALLLVANISFHEPWADEAQAWVMARDCNLAELWAKYVRYEGTPPLWHTLLFAAIRLHLPYAALNWISGLAGILASFVLIRFSPFPLWIRVALPFTYYLAYQYAVIGRGYALAPLLLFLYAHWRSEEERHRWRLAALLIALAGISAHCMLLSIAIWVDKTSRHRKLDATSLVYVLSVAAFASSAWPPADGSFLSVPEVSWHRAQLIAAYGLHQAFGEGRLPWLVLLLSALPLYSGGGWTMFLLSASSICLFSTFIHGAVWHYGLLFVAWLYALWVSYPRAKAKVLAQLALLVVLVVQCGWTLQSSRAEHKQAYSGNQQAAQFLMKSSTASTRAAFIGYATVGLQPFAKEVSTVNPSAPDGKRFWWWSVRNHANGGAERLGTLHPDQVWIGYQSEPERLLWEQLVVRSGYLKGRQFDGGVYWRNTVLQPESIALYVPGVSIRDTRLASSLEAADPACAFQLLWGFGEIVSPQWRRVDRSFTVALPKLESPGPGRLQVHFKVESGPVREHSPVHMFATIGRHRFESMSILSAGEGDFICNVPAEAMASDILSVSCFLPETSPLRLLVSSIELTPI